MTYTSTCPRIDPEIKAEWTSALRSGTINQGTGVLAQEYSGVTAYCCLGVLCEFVLSPKGIVNKLTNDGEDILYGSAAFNSFDSSYSFLPGSVMDYLKIDGDPEVFSASTRSGLDGFRTLSELNDTGFTFDQIADVIDYFL